LVEAAFIYPGVVAFVLLLVAWGPWAKRAPGARVAWGAGLAWALGYAAVYYTVWDLPPLQPKEAGHWLVDAVVLGGLVACLDGMTGGRRALHVVLGAALIGAFVWFASEPLRSHVWEGDAKLWMPAALVSTGLLHWGLTADVARRRPAGPLVAIHLAASLGAAAFVLGQSTGGSAHAAAGMIGVLVVSGFFAFVRPGREVLWGSALPYSPVLGGLLFIGTFFAKVPWISVVLLLAAPQSLRLARFFPKPWMQYAATLLTTALVCAAAAYLGLPEDDPYGY